MLFVFKNYYDYNITIIFFYSNFDKYLILNNKIIFTNTYKTS